MLYAKDGQNFRTDLNHSGNKNLQDQRAVVIWLTGLSGAGKTTIGKVLEEELLRRGAQCRIFRWRRVETDDKFRTGFLQR